MGGVGCERSAESYLWIHFEGSGETHSSLLRFMARDVNSAAHEQIRRRYTCPVSKPEEVHTAIVDSQVASLLQGMTSAINESPLNRIPQRIKSKHLVPNSQVSTTKMLTSPGMFNLHRIKITIQTIVPLGTSPPYSQLKSDAPPHCGVVAPLLINAQE